MGLYDDLNKLDNAQQPEESPVEVAAPTSSTGGSTGRLTDRGSKKSTHRSGDKPTGQTARRYAGVLQDTSPILPRPKAFYITQRQDIQIDEAVRRIRQHPRVLKRLQAKLIAQPDRSMVMRLFLDRLDGEDDELISQLVDQLIDRPVDSDL